MFWFACGICHCLSPSFTTHCLNKHWGSTTGRWEGKIFLSLFCSSHPTMFPFIPPFFLKNLHHLSCTFFLPFPYFLSFYSVLYSSSLFYFVAPSQPALLHLLFSFSFILIFICCFFLCTESYFPLAKDCRSVYGTSHSFTAMVNSAWIFTSTSPALTICC